MVFIGKREDRPRSHLNRMWITFLHFVLFLRDCFRSRKALEAKIILPRHQLGVLRRNALK
jgi:hypothetical protein